MRPWLFLLVLAAGCGRLGFEDLPGDASRDALDAAVTSPLAPFSNPMPVMLPAIGPDDDPSLRHDGLELHYNRDDELLVATRTSPTGPWETIALLSVTAPGWRDSTPELSRDGLTLYFASDRPPSQNMDLWFTTRPALDAPWAAPTHLANLSTSIAENGPAVTDDELELVFASNQFDPPELYRSTRPTRTSPWGPPELVTELNTAFDESSASLSPDGNAIYFHSDRDVGLHLYVAVRPARGQPYGPPVRITGLDDAPQHEDPWISADGRLLLYVSHQPSGVQLWQATR